jgi:hypothetical protein
MRYFAFRDDRMPKIWLIRPLRSIGESSQPAGFRWLSYQEEPANFRRDFYFVSRAIVG